MKFLDSGYSSQADNIDKHSWNVLLSDFDDVSFYQTWSYGLVQWGQGGLRHFLLRKNGRVVSIAQIRVVRVPFIKCGLAYLPWGPLWKRRGEDNRERHLRNMLRALYKEYVERLGYLLRIVPRHISTNQDCICRIFSEEGFSFYPDRMQTVYLDLNQGIQQIKQNTRRKWRQTLNKAMKQDVELTEWTDDKRVGSALGLIKEMKDRKKYMEFGSMEDVLTVSRDLPDDLKLRLSFCIHNREPVAVLGWFPVGETGLPLVNSTGNKALALSAAYPLWWQMVKYYKTRGASCIDLGGVNKERNPGGYLFKMGLAGKNSREKRYIGLFEACENVFSSLTFKTGLLFREGYRCFITNIHKIRNHNNML